MQLKNVSIKTVLLSMLALTLALSLFAVPGLAAQPAAAQGDGPAGTQTITVTGFGSAFGSPDVARIGLGVEVSNPDILAAMEQSNTQMNAVIMALQANGVAAEDIRTEYFSIYQDYYGPSGPAESGVAGGTPYRVSNSLNVTVRDTDRVGEILAAAVSAGANVVNFVQFEIDDRAALQSEARSNAVADAQARAEELAGLLGLSVGRALSINENSDYYMPFYGGGGGGGMGAASAPPISQGQLSVSMAVTITFELQ